MALSAELLNSVGFYLDGAIKPDDLQRLDWRRQTDMVKYSFTVARLFADLQPGDRAVFVDGHISTSLKAEALESGSVKSYFNRRCHDAGFKTRRVIVYDTVTTRKMGGKGKSAARLHFHAVFEQPAGWTRHDLMVKLTEIYGLAQIMGQRQLHASKMNWTQHYSHNGVQVRGPLGKMFYAIKHTGAAYVCLNLNEGKRSRKAPADRAACNRQAKRLAHGRPSNFNNNVIFCDNASKAAGKEAFDAWVRANKTPPTLKATMVRTKSVPSPAKAAA